MIRSLVKLAVGYAVTRALTRAGGPAGLLGAVFGGSRSGHDQRTNRGGERTTQQKRADTRRRGH